MLLSDFSIRRPVVAIVASLLLVVFGLYAVTQMSVRETPNIDRPNIGVQVNYPGASAEVVESKVVKIIEDQISGAYAQFEKMIEQLQNERESRVADLKSELGAVVKLLDVEHRRMANVLPITAPSATPPQGAQAQMVTQPQIVPPQIVPPQISLSEFILRKLNDIGPMSKEDLITFAMKDGMFPDAESTERAVHAALISTLRNEQIRQLQDGTFAPVSMAQTVRFRRAI